MKAAFLVLIALGLQEATETVRVEQRWTGERTNITEREIVRVVDAGAWGKLWERHEGKGKKPPQVDFEKHLVVAAFLGKVDYQTIDVHQVKKTKDEVVIGLEVERPACCDFAPRPLWCILVLPRTELRMSVVMRVRANGDVDPRKDELLSEIPPVK